MSKRQDSYEEKVERLEGILKRLDDSQTPIDELSKDVKQGTELIKELNQKLKQVESDVVDAFQGLDESVDAVDEGQS